MTQHRFTNIEPGTASLLYAHGGSHDRSVNSQQTETSAVKQPAAEPEVQNHNPADVPKPSSTPVESISGPVAHNQTPLAGSVMGLPFGLGELSLGLILVGPICLLVLRRWLQS